ncbi:uncharacterized protein KLLA0_D15565g [Kluyveromyces lactis]|uniref:KLLA0D15565p n=1 Tax=Kluyveromyces lactis (strain ATCC 8585 / CBS 2359 / DSM 70799 / NBRC 1267 / NRRL Y-1140 / WM37) TaxID=284590 RepID=Q6CQP0_KLULA|nr:uncharacterized protein KLLA0_D15565g [Kluyveromyces lactis]CAH00845.1 KLLA0D15565p [Kluyveromyces lactis]|eukprot:XP_453749.1 uncharacterized protein KLLA0_D15565g [Kluyveromyces lactis]
MRPRTRSSWSVSDAEAMEKSSHQRKRVALSEQPLHDNKLKSSVGSLRNSQVDEGKNKIYGNSSQTTSSVSLKRQIYRDDDDEEQKSDVRSDDDILEPRKSHKRLKCESLERRREELDSQDKEDVTMCYDYSDDIFDHLYTRQFETTPKINYLKDKNYEFYLRPTMRSILVDWIIEVHCKFQLLPETLYLSINLMDRYLSFNKVTLPKLQLIAITSLLIAAKFEEVNLPKLSNYSYITDNAYSNDEIKQAEFVILNKLEYNIGWPNPLNFLRRISRCDEYDSITRTLGKCLIGYMISCPHFIDVVPSKIASVAMFTAQRIVHEDFQWDELWDYYSCFSFKDNEIELKELSQILINDIAKPTTQLNALIHKYKKIGTWNKIHDWCLKHCTYEELNPSDYASSSPASSTSL